MEEEPDKQKIKADTVTVSGKGDITESSLGACGLRHWGYQPGSTPLGHCSASGEQPLLKASHLGVTWADCSSTSQEMGREQTQGNVKAN